MRWFTCLIAFAGLVASGCSETPSNPDTEPNPEPPPPSQPPPEPTTIPELIVSEALSPAVVQQTAGARSTIAIAYVSLPPGTRRDKVSVRIRNLTSGGNPTALVPVIEGGFDPVTVPASAGDRLELRFTDGTGAVAVDFATVVRRRPVIVRTAPSTGRTDVALLVRPVVVFSEPIDPATLPIGMHLLSDGTPVSGHGELLPSQPWIAEFVPASPLEPSTRYQLELTQGIEGVGGEPLEAPFTAEFTTQPSTVSPAGARITVRTTGPDVDPDGYRVLVDGSDRGTVGVNGTMVTQFDPGTRAIALGDLAANCAVDGPGERTVTVAASELATIEFAVVCTRASRTIEVVVTASGADVGMVHDVLLDGREQSESMILDRRSGAGRLSLRGVLPGDHVVALRPYQANCSVEDSPQSVTLPADGQVRVAFTVTCSPNLATLRITAPTTGSLPSSTRFRAMHGQYDYWGYGTDTYTPLGDVEPNGTLIALAPANGEGGYPYWHDLWFDGVPGNCHADAEIDAEERNGLGSFALRYGDTVHVELTVTCSP
jgi:hypothetical protein